MSSLENKAKIMEDGDIGKVIWKFAVPGIISSIISAIYNIVDTAFVGMLHNTAAMAAVSVVFPLFILINAVGQMIGIGSSSYIARLLGAKDKEHADRVASTAVIIGVVIGAIITIITTMFLGPILRLLGATDSIMEYALGYAMPIAIGSILPIMIPTMANMIRAEGNTKFSAVVIALGAIINIVLDPILMFNFNMGIVGASVATVISQLCSVVILAGYYISKKGYLNISIKKFELSKDMLNQIISVGMASFVTQALISASMGVLNIVARPYGEALIASFGISLKVSSLVVFIVIGYNQGFQPVASYNYGAGHFNRLQEAIKISVKRTTIFATLATIFLMIFAKNAINIFSTDPEVIALGVKTLRGGILMFPMLGIIYLYSALYQSLGMAKEAMIVGTARQGIFFMPLIFILPQIFGVDGVIFTQAIADFLTTILTVFYAIKTNNYLKEKVNLKESLSC